MDERLQLTEAQWRIVHNFNNILREMKRENIGLVFHSGKVSLINLKNVDDVVEAEDMIHENQDEIEYDEELVDFEDMTPCNLQFFYATSFEDNMGIRYKDKRW